MIETAQGLCNVEDIARAGGWLEALHFGSGDFAASIAERIIEAMREAQAQHRGAVALDGKLIDLVSIRMAENILEKARTIAARSSAAS